VFLHLHHVLQSIICLTDYLHFSAQENGTVILVMMLCAVPGAYVGGWVTRRFNAILSSMAAITLLIATTIAVSIVLEGSGQQLQTYILLDFGVWGLGGSGCVIKWYTFW
jgi:MFS-type transporter involved in bile tolerance (Atg22 family)